MSHINDALKRAQQAQQENPPATPPLEFRPVEPDQQPPRRSTTLMVGLSLVIVAIFGLSSLLVYFISQSDSSTLQVAARVIDPPLAPLAAASTAPADPKTNAAVAVAVVPPPAPPMKLQGIFFNPRNPLAVINGTSFYLGDSVGGFRVKGISPTVVILVSATATNVLSLSRP